MSRKGAVAERPRAVDVSASKRRLPRRDQPKDAEQPLEPTPAAPSRSRAIWFAAIAASVLALVVYLRTLAPTVATGDSGELSWVAVTLGLAHPPGYPTFTILGHLFSLLPIGDPAYRVNLLSALAAAASVGVLGVVVGRTVLAADARASDGGSFGRAAIPVVVVFAGLLVAVSTAFWHYALVAEVFGLSSLLGLLVLALMLEWARRPDRPRYLWGAALASGLALTNQQTILFAAPALVILLGVGIDRHTSPRGDSVPKRGPRAQPPPTRPVPWRWLALAVAIAIVGLVPYLYLPLAAANGAPTVWGDPRSITGFLGIVARIAYGTFSLTVRDTSGSVIEHLGLFGVYLTTALTPVGIALAAVGWVWLARRRTAEAIALAVWFLMTGPVFLALADPPLSDPVTRGVLERFYILPSIVVVIAAGLGAWAFVSEIAERITRPQLRRVAFGAATVVLVLAPAGVAVARAPDVDQSGIRIAATYPRDILEPLPPNSLLLMRGDENYTSVVYAQEVAGVRKDVLAIDTELLKLPSYVDFLKARDPTVPIPFAEYAGAKSLAIGNLIDLSIDARPVFVIGSMEEDLGKRFDLLAEGLASRVLKQGQAPDPLAGLRADPRIFDRLHPPPHAYPDTSWEGAIAATYADLAFRTGLALQQLSPQQNVDQVASYYRTAIRLDPTLASAYKNLGLLFDTNAAHLEEIPALWERYLVLKPNDPEAAQIRAQIQRIRGSLSPSATPRPSP